LEQSKNHHLRLEGKNKKKEMSLARKASIFTISRAVTIIAQLAGIIILTRSLPKEIYGQLQYMLTIYATIQVFGQLGLPDSVFYFFEKLPSGKRKSIAQLISKTLGWLAVAGSLILLVVGWATTLKDGYTDVHPLIWMFMVLLVLELPTIPLPNVLIALDKTKSAAWFNILIGLAQFLAMTLPLLTADPLPNIVLGLVLYGVLRLCASAFLFHKNFKDEPAEPLPKGFLKELLNYSVPLSLAQLFWGLNRQVDKFVVQAFLPVAVLAEYANGAYELPIVPTIAYSVAAVMMPNLVSHHLKGEQGPLLELWLKSIRKVTIIVLPLVVFFVMAAKEFMVLMFGEAYVNSAIPFQIYTFILLQRVASYSNMQKALGSTKEITRGAVYLFSINAILCIPLLLWFGVAGPPLASVVAQTFTWWYALNVIRKLIGVKFTEVFPFRFYGKALLISALAALPFYFMKNQWDLPVGLAFPVLAVGYFSTYGILARATNVIGKEDVERIFRKKK